MSLHVIRTGGRRVYRVELWRSVGACAHACMSGIKENSNKYGRLINFDSRFCNWHRRFSENRIVWYMSTENIMMVLWWLSKKRFVTYWRITRQWGPRTVWPLLSTDVLELWMTFCVDSRQTYRSPRSAAVRACHSFFASRVINSKGATWHRPLLADMAQTVSYRHGTHLYLPTRHRPLVTGMARTFTYRHGTGR